MGVSTTSGCIVLTIPEVRVEHERGRSEEVAPASPKPERSSDIHRVQRNSFSTGTY